MLRTDTQTDTQTHIAHADKRFTPATVVGVSNKYVAAVRASIGVGTILTLLANCRVKVGHLPPATW